MDVESGNQQTSYGRKAISRRQAAPSSGNVNITATAASNKAKLASPSSILTGSKAKHKKQEDDEVEPLLVGAADGGAIHATPTTTTGHAAKQFADSWMGTMLKVKAKQAGRHVYNLRANMASKKGFHVQVPKRMLFYTGLIFLVLPLFFFFGKETQIHRQHHQQQGDLARHAVKLHDDHDSIHNQHHQHSDPEHDLAQQGYNQQQLSNNERLRGHPNKKKKVTKESLQQLLGGGVNASSPSGSRKDNSKKMISGEGGASEQAAASLPLTNNTSANTRSLPPGATAPPAANEQQQDNDQQEKEVIDEERLQKQEAAVDPTVLLEAENLAGDTKMNVPPTADEANKTNDHITHDEER